MQAQHIIIALSAAWILTLALLPYLVSRITNRAQAIGYDEGISTRDQARKKALARLVHELRRRQALIEELEERISSYSGLAVSRRDHQTLMSTIETLNMAKEFWSAMAGVTPWRDRAVQQARELTAPATRVHAGLRAVSAAAPQQAEAKPGEAA